MCIYKYPQSTLNESTFLMEDTTVDVADIIDVLPRISNGIVTDIDNFLTDTDIIYRNARVDYLECFETYKQNAVCVDSEKQIIETLEDNSLKNSAYVAKLQTSLEELTCCLNSLTDEVREKESKKHKLEIKNSAIEKKKKMLLEKRDEIQASKLLTNTNFYLHGTDVVGYSYCKITQKIKPFEFNPSKTSEKDIVNLLYENILTVSSSSTQDVDE